MPVASFDFTQCETQDRQYREALLAQTGSLLGLRFDGPHPASVYVRRKYLSGAYP